MTRWKPECFGQEPPRLHLQTMTRQSCQDDARQCRSCRFRSNGSSLPEIGAVSMAKAHLTSKKVFQISSSCFFCLWSHPYTLSIENTTLVLRDSPNQDSDARYRCLLLSVVVQVTSYMLHAASCKFPLRVFNCTYSRIRLDWLNLTQMETSRTGRQWRQSSSPIVPFLPQSTACKHSRRVLEKDWLSQNDEKPGKENPKKNNGKHSRHTKVIGLSVGPV
jgi:hypothetical protein